VSFTFCHSPSSEISLSELERVGFRIARMSYLKMIKELALEAGCALKYPRMQF
jgi:hypothetical protein